MENKWGQERLGDIAVWFGLVLNMSCKIISLKSMLMADIQAAPLGALQNPQDLGHTSNSVLLSWSGVKSRLQDFKTFSQRSLSFSHV